MPKIKYPVNHKQQTEQLTHSVFDEPDDLVSDLAWEYSQMKRNGQHPQIEDFLAKLPTAEQQEEFQIIISMDELIATSVKADIDMVTAIEQKENS